MKIIVKKVNNTLIFYDKDIEINIEELFRSGFFDSSDVKNVEWINNETWVKKHYFRKGMMSFLGDKYLYSILKNTRSYREFQILDYLHKHKFNTCKPVIGWATYNGATYTANLVTEAIKARTVKDLLDSSGIKYVRNDIFRLIGAEVAKMHNLNVFHGDLNINNIMISDGPKNNMEEKVQIWIIDFDKSMKTGYPIKKSDRYSNVERLKRSLIKTDNYDDVSFREFLNTYQSLIKF